MGFFDNFNPFDPLGLFGGGGPPGMGGGGGDSSSAGGLSIGGGPNQETTDKANEFDPKKAYGIFGGGGDSQFNQMRKQQLGMGRQGD